MCGRCLLWFMDRINHAYGLCQTDASHERTNSGYSGVCKPPRPLGESTSAALEESIAAIKGCKYEGAGGAAPISGAAQRHHAAANRKLIRTAGCCRNREAQMLDEGHDYESARICLGRGRSGPYQTSCGFRMNSAGNTPAGGKIRLRRAARSAGKNDCPR